MTGSNGIGNQRVYTYISKVPNLKIPDLGFAWVKVVNLQLWASSLTSVVCVHARDIVVGMYALSYDEHVYLDLLRAPEVWVPNGLQRVSASVA